jgi:hypothetical protein
VGNAAAAITKAKLNKQDGVRGAQIDFSTKTAAIRFDPGKLSRETGFKAEPMTFSKAR